jgi:hypothetical protein
MNMHLTRLRVEQVRQFRQPFELSDIGAGLNIFSGPNEAGKSTLVRAIRAAFFERYRSKAVDDLRPWGDSAATPTITLDFTFDGQPHALVKTFLGSKPRCDLRIGNRALDGTDAEDHLAQVFGYGFAGKGASKTEHWGIPGLLWVEQGTGQTLREAALFAREHLHDALQSRLGQAAASTVAASGGDAVLATLLAQRGELLTATGKPRGELDEAQQRVATASAELSALKALVQTYQGDVDRLAELRRQHAQDAAEQPWAALQAPLQAARSSLQALEHSEQQLADARTRHAQLEQQVQLLLSQLDGFVKQQQAADQREAAHRQAAQELPAADDALRLAAAQAEPARARSQAARAALLLARQEATRASLTQQTAAALEAQARHQQAIAQADEAQRRLTALRQQAQALPIDKPALERLRKLDRQWREAVLQRQAVATRLQFELQDGARLTLSSAGQAAQLLAGQGQLLLVESGTLDLPGLGRLTLTPGGHEQGDLARQQAAAEDGLQAAMQQLGVADLAEAESRFSAQQEAQAQLKLAEQALSLSAPQGLDRLRQDLVDVQALAGAAQQALAKLPSAPVEVLLSPQAAEAAWEAAQTLEDAATAALNRATQARASAAERLATAEREWALARAPLADPGRLQRHADSQQQLLAVGSERDALAARVAQISAQIQAARPDIARQDIARFEQSIQQQQQAHQHRALQIQLLESALQLQGAQGLDEQLEGKAGELDRAQRRHADLRLRAAALALLCSKLEAKRQATLARLQAPLQAHMQRYLQLLFPDARLAVNEQLAPGQLTRRNANGALEDGDFEALSFGAREQLGLISRFAYADLLREAGRPTLLILDDALVHSDSARLAQMKRVIFDAAQRHQLLLFTCHPEDWRDMGVALRPLG